MLSTSDTAYFTERADQSREAAQCAGDNCSRIIHLQFAAAYDRLLGPTDGPEQTSSAAREAIDPASYWSSTLVTAE